MTKKRSHLISPLFLWLPLYSCGAGLPVELRVDQFTFDVAIDEVVENGFAELLTQGFLPPETQSFPVVWPDELPDIQYRTSLSSEPVPIDLSVEEGDPNFDDFKLINQLSDAINRIELNRVVLRIDRSNLNENLPELELQVADDKDADPEDRLAWRTVGVIPATPEPGFVGDLEFEYDVSGESFLNSQFLDDAREFALRVRGDIEVDTEANPIRPSGMASLRMIAVLTFFVDPIALQQASGALTEAAEAE